MARAAMNDIENLTRTAGYIMNNGQFSLLTGAYRQTMGLVQAQILSGAVDYNTAIRNAMKPFVSQGLTSVGYESGVTRSIEAVTRQTILQGTRDTIREMWKDDAERLGTDGWELSAHANCAPDHEPYQGRQYSNEEYEKLNNSLERRIGTRNCHHIAFPIILGVSEPAYSEAELAEMKRKNAEGFTYEEKHYTGYEATQMQRRLERSIRKTKRELIEFDDGGLRDEFTAGSIKLRRQREIYADFCKQAGLTPRSDRTQTSGYGRSMSGKVLKAEKTIDGIVTSTGITTHPSNHMFVQAKARGLQTSDIPDALTNPLKIGKIKKDRTQKFIGLNVTAVVNVNTGKIVTVWETSSKLVAKIKEIK
jgi:hypothetical protein